MEDHQGLVEPRCRGEVVPSRSLVVTKGSRPYNDTKTQVVTSSQSRVTGTSVLRKQSITLASEGARRPGLQSTKLSRCLLVHDFLLTTAYVKTPTALQGHHVRTRLWHGTSRLAPFVRQPHMCMQTPLPVPTFLLFWRPSSPSPPPSLLPPPPFLLPPPPPTS